MQAIVNVSSGWGIGNKGSLLASIPEDMRFFRETTQGKIVVMGRKTLESFPGGRPLKNRTNIVLTRDPSRVRAVSEPDRPLVVVSSEEQLAEAIADYPAEDVFIIGGETIYRQLLPYCSRCLVTKNDMQTEADAWFPNLDELDNWHLSKVGEPKEHEDISYCFTTYVNDSPLSFGTCRPAGNAEERRTETGAENADASGEACGEKLP